MRSLRLSKSNNKGLTSLSSFFSSSFSFSFFPSSFFFLSLPDSSSFFFCSSSFFFSSFSISSVRARSSLFMRNLSYASLSKNMIYISRCAPQLPWLRYPARSDDHIIAFPSSTHLARPSEYPLSVRFITSLPSALTRATSILFHPPMPIYPVRNHLLSGDHW